jgi:ABC-2 type transport system ATP-binding protein
VTRVEGPVLEGVAHRRGSFVLTCPAWSTRPGLTVVVGLNGAGKTTLLRLLAGVDSPSEGTAQGTAATVLLPQGARLETRERVASALSYIAGLRGVGRSRRTAAVDEALRATGLGGKRDERLRDLSGGWHQRVMVAQCLLGPARVLLLDEPTASLDVGAARSVWTVLSDLSKDVAVVISTHEASAAVEFADQVVVISDGVVYAPRDGAGLREAMELQQGSPESFLLALLTDGPSPS